MTWLFANWKLALGGLAALVLIIVLVRWDGIRDGRNAANAEWNAKIEADAKAQRDREQKRVRRVREDNLGFRPKPTRRGCPQGIQVVSQNRIPSHRKLSRDPERSEVPVGQRRIPAADSYRCAENGA